MSRLLASCEQLATVQRLDELELEQARAAKTKADAVVEQQSRTVGALQARVEQARRLAESQMTSGAGVGAMRQLADYANWQARALQRWEAELSKARDAAEQARAHLMRCFERLSVIERLRERRMRELELERARMEQNTLDDYGTIAVTRRR